MTVHVINLDRDTERLAAFRTINAHLPAIERFRAVEGRSANRTTLRMMNVIREPCGYNDSQLGTALSHIKLWRQAVKERETLTIAEDDAIFAPNFDPEHRSILARLPENWGVVLWGWNFNARLWVEIPEGAAFSGIDCDQTALRQNLEVFRRTDALAAPVRLRHAFGTMAYTVSPRGARTLLDICLPLTDQFVPFVVPGTGVQNIGIDCMASAAYGAMKSYVSIPPLVISENRVETSHTINNN